LPPFQGGIAGLFSYEFAGALETLPRPACDAFAVPDWAIAQYDLVIAFDHLQNRAWIVSTGWESAVSARLNRDYARSRLSAILQELRRPKMKPRPATIRSRVLVASDLSPQFPLSGFPGVSSNFDRSGFESAVQRAIDYIHAGDCFQVNLAQRLLAPLLEHPLDLYGRLRTINPAPFGAYFDLGDFQILSASPERFLQVSDRQVETRPIKGTRPRGKTPEEDAAAIRDLTNNAKDRAENVMIVDLLRNDLGKVCQYGSVRVPRVCEVESFPFIHHLVSEVRGELRAGLGPLDLLAAAFPGGSVTGAPKIRAMEIIAELEPTVRGPYCGCLGWIGFDGSADTSILIRTFTAGRGWLQFPVGGGIVADSDPAREYEETLHKAAGMLRSLSQLGKPV
jgi:para-aminobenzoate synthetase component 1